MYACCLTDQQAALKGAMQCPVLLYLITLTVIRPDISQCGDQDDDQIGWERRMTPVSRQSDSPPPARKNAKRTADMFHYTYSSIHLLARGFWIRNKFPEIGDEGSSDDMTTMAFATVSGASRVPRTAEIDV